MTTWVKKKGTFFFFGACAHTDGEANFYFGRRGPTDFYQFFYQIQLHIDDFQALGG